MSCWLARCLEALGQPGETQTSVRNNELPCYQDSTARTRQWLSNHHCRGDCNYAIQSKGDNSFPSCSSRSATPAQRAVSSLHD